MRGEVEEVVVSYIDRLARFAHELIERIFKIHHTKLIIENRKEHVSDEQELAEDLLAIVHVFSCRVNGKRRYCKNDQCSKTVDGEASKGKRLKCDSGDSSGVEIHEKSKIISDDGYSIRKDGDKNQLNSI